MRTLEKKGLIERQKREGDERSKFPHLTKQGAALVEQAIPLVERIDHLFFDQLGSDLAKCTEILQKLS